MPNVATIAQRIYRERQAKRHPLNGHQDPEHYSRIEAERVTLEMRARSFKRVDAGRECIEDSPLFGGPRQADLFAQEGGR